MPFRSGSTARVIARFPRLIGTNGDRKAGRKRPREYELEFPRPGRALTSTLGYLAALAGLAFGHTHHATSTRVTASIPMRSQGFCELRDERAAAQTHNDMDMLRIYPYPYWGYLYPLLACP